MKTVQQKSKRSTKRTAAAPESGVQKAATFKSVDDAIGTIRGIFEKNKFTPEEAANHIATLVQDIAAEKAVGENFATALRSAFDMGAGRTRELLMVPYRALGHLGEKDDNPVVSTLNAIASDLRILAHAVDNGTWTLDAFERGQAIERLALRVLAIAELAETNGGAS